MTYLHILILLGFSFSVGQAQNYSDVYHGPQRAQTDLPFHLKTQVKSIDDFIARFNGYHNAYGDSIDIKGADFIELKRNKKYWRKWREKIIGSLLNKNLLEKDKSQSWKCIQTLSTIPEISKLNSHMSAFLPVEVFMPQKSVRAEIELHYIALSGARFEWIISNITFCDNLGDICEVKPYLLPMSPPEDYLPPNADGNGFILLQRKIKNTRSVADYVSLNKIAFQEFEILLRQSFSISFRPVYFQFNIPTVANFKVDEDFSIFQFDLPQ